MSNVELIIAERAAQIGDFLVGRLLPFRQKRSVGPFVFIDHMGPSILYKGENLDVGPHPHIGLSTLTYLFDGAVFHRDSLGSEIEIVPGSVAWMTAGKGIVHSERTPVEWREKTKNLHGLQIWIALPKDKEQMPPKFTFFQENEIPKWTEHTAQFKLIAGNIADKKSPIPVYSPLYLLEIKSQLSEQVNLKNRLFGESAIYILNGSLTIDEHHYDSRQLLVSQATNLDSLTLGDQTTIYVLGGMPFDEPRYIDWNFVSSDKELLRQAREDWKYQRFPKITNEHDFIPYPEN